MKLFQLMYLHLNNCLHLVILVFIVLLRLRLTQNFNVFTSFNQIKSKRIYSLKSQGLF